MQAVSELFRGLPAYLVVKASHASNDPWDVTIKTKGEKSIVNYELALEGLDEEEKEYIHEVRDDALFLETLMGQAG